jgi:hypothetical protein
VVSSTAGAAIIIADGFGTNAGGPTSGLRFGGGSSGEGIPSNRVIGLKGAVVLLPVASACQLKYSLTAVALPLLKLEATKLTGSEVEPFVLVAAVFAGRVNTPRTVSVPFTSSVAAGVDVLTPIFTVASVPVWTRAELARLVALVQRGTKFGVPRPGDGCGRKRGSRTASGLGRSRRAGCRISWRCEHEGRSRQSANSFRIPGFQGIRNTDEEHAGLSGLACNLHAEPASFIRGEKIGWQTFGLGGPEHDLVVAEGIELDTLSFDPQWSAALLILVEGKGHSCDPAGGAFRRAAELHQLGRRS